MRVTEKALTRASSQLYRPLADVWCGGCGLRNLRGITARAVLKTIPAKIGIDTNDPSWLRKSENIKALKDNVALVTGIGCTARMSGYFDLWRTMNVTHGRPLAYAAGLKMANPNLEVLVVTGDGDNFAIGGNHFLHAALRNLDLNLIVYDNGIYGMTSGQFSDTTPAGEFADSAPYGVWQKPLDPIKLALGLNTSFVAQGAITNDQERANELEELIAAGIRHQGFSFINVIGTCHTERGGRNKLPTAFASKEFIAGKVLPFDEWLKLSLDEQAGRYPLGIIHQDDRSDYHHNPHYLDALAKAQTARAAADDLLEAISLSQEDRFSIVPSTVIRFSGAGGQGVVTAAKIMAEAASRAGFKAANPHNYEAEQRGGSTDGDVILSQGRIISPVVSKTDFLVVLNPEDLERYVVRMDGTVRIDDELVPPSGKIFANSTNIFSMPDDNRVLASPMGKILNDVYAGLSSPPQKADLGLNIVAVGLVSGFTDLLPREAVEAAVMESSAGRKAPQLNTNALHAGFAEADRLKETKP
jgi:2-oxoglutarate ferredoxin oxidoreductase subunit beta